jgi:S1-C subfamily serine protease
LPATLATGLVLSAAAVVSSRVGGLKERLEQAEDSRLRLTADLRQDLAGVENELSELKSELASTQGAVAGTSVLSARLEEAEKNLGTIGAALEAHSSSLIELEATQASFGPGLEKELAERDERLGKRYEALKELVTSAERGLRNNEARLEALDRTLAEEPDLVGMWRELVGPVVQLAGENSVGSGVLLRSEPCAEGGFRTPILTAWHVVRDIQGDPPVLTLPVPVRIYREDGTTRNTEAKLLAHDPKLDAALLEIVSDSPFEHGASLAPRSRLAAARIFDAIVAVGCPLGNDPIPTRGEIATCQHEVEGERYWMINAPTYIGNSGGGIFAADTHELLGIFSKIYTHGSLRPTIVPHMGLVTPLGRIYDWLEREGHGALVPDGSSVVEAGH